MQNETTSTVSTVETTIVPTHAANAPAIKPEPSVAQPVPSAETVAAITDAETAKRAALAAKLQAKRQAAANAPAPVNAKAANAKAAKQRVASKLSPAAQANGKQARAIAATAKPAKPSAEARAKAQADANDSRRLARDVAAKAVAAFYSGSSLPFKAASDRFADFNPANAKATTARQAGLLLALITYGAGNMLSDGTFIRGAFNVPARLIHPSAKPGETVRAQPESGCLCNMLGRAVDYVAGPKTGREQATATYRIRTTTALAEIAAVFGDKQRNAAAKLLAGFPAKRAA